MRARIMETAVCGILAGVYYGLCAQFLAFWTVDGLATAFSLEVGPGLAVLWVAVEVLLFIVPFVAISIWAGWSHRSGLLGGGAALAAFWLPAVVALASALAFGVPAPAFAGIGGAVTTWLALATDVAASAIGLSIVCVAGGKSRLQPAAAD